MICCCRDASNRHLNRPCDGGAGVAHLSKNKRRGITTKPKIGDIVTVELSLQPESGFVPESLFDRKGTVQFVVGGGHYLPALHELVQTLGMQQSLAGVSIDAGYGARQKQLVVQVPKAKLGINNSKQSLKVGDTIPLSSSSQRTALVTECSDSTVTIDANAPLAGSSYSCNMTLLNIQDPSEFETADFALGCFWGAELLFMRIRGVVGTRVGYTQGSTLNPTYEQVCQGTTQHREAVQVIFDPNLVPYRALVQSALSWLKELQTPQDLHNLFAEQNDPQYRSGFYYQSEEQRRIAQTCMDSNNRTLSIELLPAARFWEAEGTHQQYLYKGGQSGRKGEKEPIRCFG